MSEKQMDWISLQLTRANKLQLRKCLDPCISRPWPTPSRVGCFAESQTLASPVPKNNWAVQLLGGDFSLSFLFHLIFLTKHQGDKWLQNLLDVLGGSAARKVKSWERNCHNILSLPSPAILSLEQFLSLLTHPSMSIPRSISSENTLGLFWSS